MAQELSHKQVNFSEAATRELHVCVNAVLEIVALTESAMADNDPDKARMVEPLEEVIDALTEELKARHIQRLQAGQCTLELGFVFNDCVNNFERVADHCSNIAVAILAAQQATQLQSHDYLRTLKQNNEEDFRVQLNGYAQKYYDALTAADEISAAAK